MALVLVVELTVLQHGEPSLALAREKALSCRIAWLNQQAVGRRREIGW